MRVRIHRGGREIGGNCVELEAQGQRLVLDIGRPLWAEPGDEVPLPSIAGLATGDDPSLLGVVVSHAHPDHYGLAGLIPESVPVFMGEATSRILREAAFFTPSGLGRVAAAHLVDRQALTIGPFTVTPFLVDHSAFDAYALLIEADGRRLFYSGDFRAHGRKAALFERLVREPPHHVDALLLEGTRLGRSVQADEPESEHAVEERCVEVFREAKGLVLAAFSMQNIDRLVTFYRAAIRSSRHLVLDLYGAAMTRATDNPRIPQPGFDHLRFFVPQAQRIRVKRSRQFERVQLIDRSRIYPEQLAGEAGQLVVSFRPSMIGDLERAGCLDGAVAVWSMWPGYLDDPSAEPLKAFLERHAIPMETIHASGHATIGDLRRLATAVDPGRVVPIHTAAPGRFSELFERVEWHRDGEWWEV